MMEINISNEVESNKYPVVSHPRPAPARNNSKIGRIKIRTPAEINKEFDDTHNSASASMSVDSPDRLRALSFADFLRPPNPSPSVPSISTVSQLKEPSAKVEKPKRKSRYPGFGENTQSQLTEPSAKVLKPKRKSRYAGFGETIPSQLTEPSSKVEKSNPGFGGTMPSASRRNKAFQPESSSSRENQEKVDDSFSSVTRSYPTPSSVTRSFPTPSSVTRSFPTPSSVTRSFPKPSSVVRSYPTPSSVTRSFLTPSKAIVSYSTPSSVTTSSLTPSLVSTSYPTPASITTSRPTKSVPNEAGRGIRRNYSGFGGTTILSPSQGNRLKEHRVSDNDARNISASWQTLKPSLKPTDFKIPNKNQVSSSASVSKSSAARSSSSQTAQDQVEESFSDQVKQACLSHKLPQATPKLLQHFRPNPGFEKDKLYNISKPTGFNLRRENMASTPSSFPTSANSTGSQVIRKTKYKETKYKGVTSSVDKIGFDFYRENSESTPVSVSQAKSDPNKSDVEGSNIRKKYPGFGEIRNSKDLQVIEKTKDRRLPSSDNKTAKNSVREKLSSTYKIHELDEISKSREEDWDSSLREWIPSEQCANVQKRKAYRGFGEVTNSRKKKKPKTDAGVRINFDKTNKQQPKTSRSRELRRITLPEENSIGSPSSVANFSTETILEDLSSGFTEKMDENDNTNLQENYEVQNDDMSTDTDTEDGGRKKLLDGVVFTISGYEDPLRGQIVGKAVAMGARYRTGWTNDCSHLVCGFIDTFKYLQAKGRGKIVRGSWIEDCYKLRKKVDWNEHILSEEKADNDPTDENADNEPTEKTSSKNDGVRFLAGMAVRLKDSCLFEQFAGKAAFVRGMYHDRVHVVIQGYGQLSLAPVELEHLMPERGNKAKYVMKCLGENTVEVVNVDEGKGIAVVRYDGYKGAVFQLNHLCRVEEI